mmetsp:Transcript_53118/g.142020  ORF Transcript_53118/g.142020 Transcript_53118/m.142020 type:complete len:213 (-) Transcript_53118:237-875(-)
MTAIRSPTSSPLDAAPSTGVVLSLTKSPHIPKRHGSKLIDSSFDPRVAFTRPDRQNLTDVRRGVGTEPKGARCCERHSSMASFRFSCCVCCANCDVEIAVQSSDSLECAPGFDASRARNWRDNEDGQVTASKGNMSENPGGNEADKVTRGTPRFLCKAASSADRSCKRATTSGSVDSNLFTTPAASRGSWEASTSASKCSLPLSLTTVHLSS